MFSVVIPVGPGRDAARALASLRAAGVGEDDEVILVGDGHVPVVAPAFAGLPLRVISLRERGGANAARNEGARAAGSPWVCFLDDDDAYTEGSLRALRNRITAYPDAVVWSAGWRIQSGRRVRFLRRPAVMREPHLWKRNHAGGCSSMILRRGLLDDLGGFDEAMPSMQDWDMWLRISRQHGIHAINEPLVLYNDHTGPRISTNTESRLAGLERLLQKHGTRWPRSVRAFHRARLQSERYAAGKCAWTAVPQVGAPLASLYFLFRALTR